MSGSGGRNWRGRSSSSTPPPAKAQATSPSRNWRNQKRATSKVRKSTNKRLPRLIVGGVLLLMLTATAIWLYQPRDRVHTYFYVFDPLSNLAARLQAATIEFPETTKNSYYLEGVHKKYEQAQFAKSADYNKSVDNVSVVYYRPVWTPDDPTLFSSSLKELKEQFKDLPEDHVKLLIVDVNSVSADWRNGYFGELVPSELRTWPEDVPNLAVIVSSEIGERSYSADLPGWGGTIFERFVEQGFSTAGDRDGNKELTLLEFYDYVSEKTNQWVTNFRSGGGQTVKIFPPRESLTGTDQQKSFGNVVLMKSLPEPINRSPDSSEFSSSRGQIASYWERLFSLPSNGNAFPVRSRTVASRLRMAELALQNGLDTLVEDHLERARKSLEQMEEDNRRSRELNCIVHRPELIEDISAIQTWQAAQPYASYQADRDAGLAAEEVLLENISLFPFTDFGLDKLDVQQRSEIVSNRAEVERTAAMSLANSQQVRPILKQIQQLLLDSEDRLFINPDQSANHESGESERLRSEATKLNQLAEKYLELSLKAEILEQEVVASLPDYMKWSAASWDSEPKNRKRLIDGLAKRIEINDPGRLTSTAQLQIAIANLLQKTELLLNVRSRHSITQFASEEELQAATLELENAYNETHKLWIDQVLTLSSELLGKNPAVSTENKWSQARNWLLAPLDNAQQRATLLQLGHDPIDEDDAKEKSSSSEGKNTGSSSEEERIAAWREQVIWEIAWAIRVHDLLAAILPSATNDSIYEALRSDWKQLQEQTDGPQLEATLARISGHIRRHWEQSRDFVRVTANPGKQWNNFEETAGDLYRADLAVRLFYDDDYDMLEPHTNIARELATARQIQYCLLQADRAALSGWILLTDEDERWVEPQQIERISDKRKWSIYEAKRWLAYASILADQKDLTAFKQWIGERETQNELADGLRVRPSKNSRDLIQFPYNETEAKTNLSLSVEHGANLQGLGSLSLNADDESGDLASLLRVSLKGLPVRLDQPQIDVPISVQLTETPSAENCNVVNFQTDFFYRGRAYRMPSFTVNPCPPAEHEFQFVGNTDTPRLTVNGADIRPIIFVLDWSESMLLAGNDRHKAALNALASILDENEAILSKQTKVGLILFGHRVSSDNRNGLVNESYVRYAKRNDKVATGLDKVDQLDDVATEVSPRRLELNRGELLNVIKEFDAIDPWGLTPLGAAMIEAANWLDDLNEDGGLICTITDGKPFDLGDLDDILDQDQQDKIRDIYGARYLETWRNRCEDRTAVLKKRLSSPNINTIVLALDFTPGSKEYAVLEKVFGKSGLDAPIEKVSSLAGPRPDKLRDVLAEKINPRQWTLEMANGQQLASQDLNETLELKSGSRYSVRFGNKFSTQDFLVTTGDNLKFWLDWEDESIEVQRQLASSKFSELKNANVPNSDFPTFVRARKERPQGTQAIKLTMMFNHHDRRRPVQRPAEVEFVARANVNREFQPDSTVIKRESQFGAPTWSMTLQPWPANEAVDVEVWWKMSPTPADEILRIANLAQANSPSEKKTFGGEGTPKFRLWQRETLQGGRRVFEVSLETLEGGDFDELKTMNVDVGTARILDDPRTFVPDSEKLKIDHEVTVIESGIVVHSFIYEEGQNFNFNEKVLALTTAQSRRNGAFRVQLNQIR